MLDTLVKVLVTSFVVVGIAEAAKRSALLGAVLASLPLTSLLAFLWLWRDTGDSEKIASLSVSIFWLVLPSLVLFVALPVLLRAGFGFWTSLAAASALTVAAYFLMLRILAWFGTSG